MTKHLFIVIVNYRTPDLVLECLESLARLGSKSFGLNVLIVDNASGDDSVEIIRQGIAEHGWSLWAQVLPQDYNGGFAFGNNAGICLALAEQTLPDYVMLLNPDTLVRPGAICALMEFMDVHPRVGIAGSLLENPEGGVESSAHRVHTPLSELDGGAKLGLITRLLRGYVVSEAPRTEAHACDWVSGASMIIRRQVIEDIGLMDECFFLYFEEVDYCWRAKKAGWDVWYVPESRVLHLEGVSTGINTPATRRAVYWYDSRRRFFIKHYGVSGLLLADVLWAIGRVTLLLRRALGLGGKGVVSDPSWLTADLLGGDLRSILTGKAWSTRRGLGRCDGRCGRYRAQ